MLRDISIAETNWKIIALRYFNPVGAHQSGRIGEDPTKEFANIMPYLSHVALGKKRELIIFGNDYDTPDGTGVRDYIHVMVCLDYIRTFFKLIHSSSLGFGDWSCGCFGKIE